MSTFALDPRGGRERSLRKSARLTEGTRTVNALPAADTRTLAQRVTELLREAIVTGSLPAGYPLRQEELAQRFGISRIPLREALRQLEAEGFVQIVAYRGAVVRPVSATEIRQIAEIRITLESLALDLAVRQMPDSVLDEAERVREELESETDPRRFADLYTRFHFALYECADAPLLMDSIRFSFGHSTRYLSIGLRQFHQAQLSPSLVEFLAACRRRDTEAAKQVLGRRLRQSAEFVANYLRRSAAR
jgi:DNA-binding GntR family transcriptional regulator